MLKHSPSVDNKSHSSLQINYRKTELPNGIRVVTEEIPYLRSVSCGAWINVGSRDENEQNNGITHFVEHMIFKGTKRYNSQQIARSLESVGGYLNAFTTKEHTCIYARILDEYLERAIDVISDLVQFPKLDEKDIEKEKLVVLEELKNLEDNPGDIIHDVLDLNIYRNHPLGYPIIGKADGITKFKREDLSDYIKQHFIPSQLVISAAGNIKHDELIPLVKRFFNMDTSSKKVLDRIKGPHRPSPISKVIEKPINQAHICMGTLSYSIKSQMRYPLLVINTLLGDGMSSRLFQNIREKYGFAYNVYSFVNLFRDTCNFGVYIGTDNNHIDDVIELVYKELYKLRTKPLSAGELKRTQTQLKGSTILGLESMSNRMMRLGSSELYFEDYIPIEKILQSLDSVTVEDVLEVAEKLFIKESFSSVIFKPANGKLQPI